MREYLMTSHCELFLAYFASHACMPDEHSLNTASNDKPLLGRLCPIFALYLPYFDAYLPILGLFLAILALMRVKCLMIIVSTQNLMTSHCALDYASFWPILGHMQVHLDH